MKPLTRNRMIEFTIAGIIVILLFVVMVPVFTKAQTRYAAAKAINDMAQIVKAIEMYSVDFPYLNINFAHISENKKRNSFFIQSIFPRQNWPQQLLDLNQTHRSEYDFLSSTVSSSEIPKQYLDPVPTPPKSFNYNTKIEVPGVYDIKWSPKDRNISGRYINKNKPPVFVVRQPGYVGFFEVYTPKTIDNNLFSYIEYDPSNGILNHGMVIYNAEGKVNQSYAQVEARAKQYWIDKRDEHQ